MKTMFLMRVCLATLTFAVLPQVAMNGGPCGGVTSDCGELLTATPASDDTYRNGAGKDVCRSCQGGETTSCNRTGNSQQCGTTYRFSRDDKWVPTTGRCGGKPPSRTSCNFEAC